MTHFTRDIRRAVRTLRKSPLFTVLAITSLAIGIGANTAIFTLLDQILLRSLPVHRPHELVQLRIEGSFLGNTWGNGTEISYPMYLDFRDNNEVFSGMFARFGWMMHVGAEGRTERVTGELVSGTYFPVLGVRPAVGRLFTPDDDKAPGGHPLAVLGHRYWRERFAANPGVVGQTIIVNSHPLTILGVAEAGFEGIELGSATDVYVPMMMKAQMTPGWNQLDDRRSRFARVFARLRPGVTRQQAEASLQPFFRALRERELGDKFFASASAYMKTQFLKATLRADPGFQGNSGLREYVERPLWILMAMVAGVLLIACANVAGLLVARGMARQHEIAIRLALGGSRRRVVQEMFAESLVLAVAGSAAGLLAATWGSSFLLGVFADPEIAMGVSSAPDARIVAFNFGAALLTALLFGLFPAWQTTRPALAPTLKDQSRSVLTGGPVRLRKALVVAQVALSLLLLIAAGLFINSLRNLLAQHPGFETTNLVTFTVEPSLNGYSPSRTKQFARALMERISAVPGVSAASATGIALLEGGSWNSSMTVEGRATKDGEQVLAFNNTVLPGYFAAMRIPLLLGRDFTEHDQRGEPSAKEESNFRVAIANQRFVETYLEGRNPIGRRVGFGGAPGTPTPIEIVGVVGTSKYVSIRDDAEPQLFYPMLEDDNPRALSVYVRVNRPPPSVFPELRRTVGAMDPNLPIFQMRSMEDQVNRSLVNERLVAGLSSVFGALATLLAVIGLYGVMAYTVARRTREIGIRMALGAVSHRIGSMFLKEAAVLLLAGFAVAVPVAWAASRYVESQLYGVAALHVPTVALAMLLLALIGTAGALVPARRAARIEPVAALRAE